MYEEKKFDLIGLEEFSNDLLNNHFKLYAGYVKRTNEAIEKLKILSGVEYAEVKRRFGWEFNGMRLHELYFDAMVKGGKTFDAKSDLGKTLIKQFGSFDAWKEDFLNTGKMPGIGWVVLVYDGKNFFNLWINEHDVGHLAGAKSLLVMDVFEHAFMIDYGLNKADYINAYFKAIDWSVVSERF